MLALGDQGGCLAYAIAIVSSLCVEELFYSLDTDAVKDKKEEEAEAAKKKKEADGGEEEPAAAKSERESKEEKRRRDEVCRFACLHLDEILAELSAHC